jgi:hypothetical protein
MEAHRSVAPECETHFGCSIGQAGRVEDVCLQGGGQHWARGIRTCRLLFLS